MIGPSYLMQPHAAHPDGLQQIWKYELLPLLEEYFYDQMDRESIHRTYGLATLESRLRKERTEEEELPASGVARVAEGPAAAGGASHSQSS
jgi:5-methylcytosine-specific restriction protein B